MTEKLPPVPLTEDGLDVLIDLFEGSLRGVGDDATSDPTAIREWGAKALQASGWRHAESLLPFALCPHFSFTEDDTATIDAAELAITERLDGMPQSLEDALIDGWVAIRRDDTGVTYWLCVEQRESWWQWCLLGEQDSRRWIRRPDATLLRSTPFRELPKHTRGELLAVLPDVLAWKTNGGRGPWEQAPRMTATQVLEQLGVELRDEDGAARDPADVVADLEAALSEVDEAERAELVRGLVGAGNFERVNNGGPDLTAFATFLRETADLGVAEATPRTPGEWIRQGEAVAMGTDGRVRRATASDTVSGFALHDAAEGDAVEVQASGVMDAGLLRLSLEWPAGISQTEAADMENAILEAGARTVEGGDYLIGDEWITQAELLDLAAPTNVPTGELLRHLQAHPERLQAARDFARTDVERAP